MNTKVNNLLTDKSKVTKLDRVIYKQVRSDPPQILPTKEIFMTILYIGDHLVTARTGYTHHGIYTGNGLVIHYSGFADGANTGPVEETTLKCFTTGKGYSTKKHLNRKYTGEESVKRARSRIGENLYSLYIAFRFNLWKTNYNDSKQIRFY